LGPSRAPRANACDVLAEPVDVRPSATTNDVPVGGENLSHQGLEEATATVMGVSKPRVSLLKESLRTKDEARAKILSKPVMMKFDGILAKAEAARLTEHPVRTELTEAEIKQISDYFYAYELNADEDLRVDGVGDDPLFADIHRQLTEAGVEFETPFVIEKNGSGLSPRMMNKIEGAASDVLPLAQAAFARGDID
jgi:hypothetical protein